MKRILFTFCIVCFAVYAIAQNYRLAYVEAHRYFENNNYSDGFPKMYRLAQLGYAPAQVDISMCYYAGLGVKADIDQAIYWVKLAADQGYVDGCCELGTYYIEGLGVEKNNHLGKKYLRLAAEGGSAHAMYLLGVVADEEGEDFVTQAEWYNKALKANPNHLGALFNLGYMYSHVDMYEESYLLFKRGAELGDAKCQYQVALFYCFNPEGEVKMAYKKELKNSNKMG